MVFQIAGRSLAFSSESDEGFGAFSKSISNSVRVLAGSSKTDQSLRVLKHFTLVAKSHSCLCNAFRQVFWRSCNVE